MSTMGGITLATTIATAANAAPATPGAATQRSLPLANTAESVVSIKLDSTQAPDLADWLQNEVQPVLKTWYPQIQSTLGGHTPNSFSVTISSSYDGVAYTAGDEIVLSADYFRAHHSDVGAVVHESVHVAQQAHGIQGWAVEGAADWFRYYRYEGHGRPKPPANASWTEGYGTTAYFFEYIRSHYDTNFLRQLQAAGQSGGNAETVIQQSTGTSTAQVWDEMQSRASQDLSG
ncbi:basic secretory protein-like protein [Streptomyces sp. NPDC020801]|uniref:basic secretory protein-like protein n=1 Tax=Streptomyces sp. NPDC020801 TaxID=3365093 RepID=UPI0037B75FE2